MNNKAKENRLIKRALNLYSKLRGIILYGVFGVLTTAVNFVSYRLLFSFFEVPNVPSTALAWFVSVVFAFITNKLWVFESKSLKPRVVIGEAGKFFAFRIFSGILDIVIMYVAVDRFGLDSTIWKLLSNVIVIIINFAAGKLFVFGKKPGV